MPDSLSWSENTRLISLTIELRVFATRVCQFQIKDDERLINGRANTGFCLEMHFLNKGMYSKSLQLVILASISHYVNRLSGKMFEG